jgi:O-acetyl-ADP-ribose deacetylase (regulator of RNase III)
VDITTLALDAIVTAANEQLAPGAGVCVAIHRALTSPRVIFACFSLEVLAAYRLVTPKPSV